jgi:hypothetical protein
MSRTLFFSILNVAVALRDIHWYMASGNVKGNTAFLQAHPNAITGVYLCCNWGTFAANGSFIAPDVEAVLNDMAVFTDTKRDAWIVIGVSQEAIYSGAWKYGLEEAAIAASLLVKSNGKIV